MESSTEIVRVATLIKMERIVSSSDSPATPTTFNKQDKKANLASSIAFLLES